jgi:hypothetical protein
MRVRQSFRVGAFIDVLSAPSVSSPHTNSLTRAAASQFLIYFDAFLGLMHAQVFAAQFDEDDRATEQKVKRQ